MMVRKRRLERPRELVKRIKGRDLAKFVLIEILIPCLTGVIVNSVVDSVYPQLRIIPEVQQNQEV